MKRFFLTIFLISIILNLILLNYTVFKNKFTPEIQPNTIAPRLTTQPTPPVNYCPAGCIGLIKEATEKAAPTTKNAPVTVVNSAPKESFITFGSGSNATDDWQDLPGVQAYIDSSNYGSIKSVTFEASMHVPTGNETADVRLYNATDKHPVWFSEMHFDGGSEAKLLTSQNIKLDPDNKLYIVQMKTQLKFPANLDSARLRIVTY